MRYRTYGDFARYLEQVGELHRVRVEVDPHLEITEIATRALREGRKALWFERVKGSRYPVVINGLASDLRCELALRKHPEQLGEELISFVEDALPPTLAGIWKHRSLVNRLLASPVKRVKRGLAREVVEEPDLDSLPVLTCWPEDGGRFFTLPQVITEDPRNRKRNMGMYRMQVYDKKTTGMHWQIQKGGGFHYYQAEKMGRPLELAVAIGTDPALLLATVAALPEGIDEAMFAGFLSGRRAEFMDGHSISVRVPAHAEFVLEGIVPPYERRMEGPFGDHFGHYSHGAEFPVFHVKRVTRRARPVFPATVVGIPPMEDKFLGDATQQILGPLVRVIHSEIVEMWAYYEAGFHNLLVVAVDQRYGKEAMKTALGLMGMSQLSLTKCIVLVSGGVNVKDFGGVMKEVRENFDPHFDFLLLPRVPLDTLDFTSYTMNLGSKMILDATRKPDGGDLSGSRIGRGEPPRDVSHLRSLDERILDLHLLHDTLLLVKVRGDGKEVVGSLVRREELQSVAIIAAVSDDVDIRDRESTIWGLFTRFDCERDVLFAHQELIGATPVYRGAMGIDATWKRGYPAPLVMTDEIRRRVDEHWESYWL
ncbi:MAG: UbiD family decarboxylase [Bacteroidota bacterium]